MSFQAIAALLRGTKIGVFLTQQFLPENHYSFEQCWWGGKNGANVLISSLGISRSVFH